MSNDNLNYLSPVILTITSLVMLILQEKREAKRIEEHSASLGISSQNIPPKLRKLIPLFSQWSVADDVEREEVRKKLDKKEKRKLKKTVNPLLPEINKFLGQFEDQRRSKEALLTSNLVQLVLALDAESRSDQ